MNSILMNSGSLRAHSFGLPFSKKQFFEACRRLLGRCCTVEVPSGRLRSNSYISLRSKRHVGRRIHGDLRVRVCSRFTDTFHQRM